jgi:predicted DNA-binding protein
MTRLPQAAETGAENALKSYAYKWPLLRLDDYANYRENSREVDQIARHGGADVVRRAIEHYLDDYEDLNRAIERLRDPADPVLDWEKVRRELLAQN